MNRTLLPIAACALLAASGCENGEDRLFVPEPGPATFAQVQAQVFTPTCAVANCHVTPGAPFGLDLSDGAAYGNTVGVVSSEDAGFMRIQPGNAADSYLYMKATADPRISGDPMPPLGSPVSPANLLLLQRWIDDGAAN